MDCKHSRVRSRMHKLKCVTNNFAQSVPSMSCLDNVLEMSPHTPDKTKLPEYRLLRHLEKKKPKPKIQIRSRTTEYLPPPTAQAPKVQVMQAPPHLAPRVDIIPPPDTTNNIETNTDKTISVRISRTSFKSILKLIFCCWKPC